MKKQEKGIVIELNKNIAKVRVSRHGDCENCGSCPGSNAMILEVNNTIGACKGENIVFELKDKNMLKAAFVVYMFPLIALFIGVAAGDEFSKLTNMHTYIFHVLCGSLAFAVAIALIVHYERSSRTNINNLPKIIRIM